MKNKLGIIFLFCLLFVHTLNAEQKNIVEDSLYISQVLDCYAPAPYYLPVNIKSLDFRGRVIIGVYELFYMRNNLCDSLYAKITIESKNIYKQYLMNKILNNDTIAFNISLLNKFNIKTSNRCFLSNSSKLVDSLNTTLDTNIIQYFFTINEKIGEAKSQIFKYLPIDKKRELESAIIEILISKRIFVKRYPDMDLLVISFDNPVNTTK